MTKDETSRRLRKIFKQHAAQVEPSPYALFAINRRIGEAEEPRRTRNWGARNIWRPIAAHVRPSFVLSGVMLLLVGALTGILINNNIAPSAQIQVTTPGGVEGSGVNEILVESTNITNPENSELSAGVTNQSCPSNAASNKAGYVNVYFICARSLVARQRASATGDLADAINQLVEGPTQSEIRNGIISELTNADGNLIKNVVVEGHWAVVNFSDELPVSANILSQLNATIFDFPTIQMVEYRVDDDCGLFAQRVGSGSCYSYTRAGARPGGGNREVIFLRQAQVGPRTLYTCTNTRNCSRLGEIAQNSTAQNINYRYTGGQQSNQEGTWLELITPDGEIAWVNSVGVTVQKQEESNLQELYQIVNDINFIAPEQKSLLSHVFSPVGLHGAYGGANPYGYFYMQDPLSEASKLNFDRVLENIVGVVPTENIEPLHLLSDLEYISLKSDMSGVNVYFDYRNGSAEIIGISFHQIP